MFSRVSESDRRDPGIADEAGDSTNRIEPTKARTSVQQCDTPRCSVGVPLAIDEDEPVNDAAFPLSPRALIEHQDFVRALSQSLVRDEHTADDVAQETWVAYLKRPPASRKSLRGWFATVARNHVRNSARESTRRTAREQVASRSEVDDSEVELRERIALQQKVVDAVMGLKDPYRSVILLAYYEGLSAQAIAERRGVPAGTVRAQLSRALVMLRETLDREHDGKRDTWSMGLTACLSGGKPATHVTVPLLLFGAGVVVASIVVSAWLTSTPRDATAPLASAAPNALFDAHPVVNPVQPLQQPATNPNRMSAAAAGSPAGSMNIHDMTIDDLVRTGQMVQRLLRDRLLTPDPALLAARPDLTGDATVKFTRMWHRYVLGADSNNLVNLNGAASFLSFVTGRQDYDEQPDLGLQSTFSSGFYGASRGVVIRVGPMRLSDFGAIRPDSINVDGWNTLHEPSHAQEQSIPNEFEQRLLSLRVPGEPGIVDHHLYVVRSVLPGEHDVLAAFEILDHDEKSVTIAWRVLNSFDVPSTRASIERRPVLPVPTPELVALSTEQLIDLHKQLVDRAQHLILSVPQPLDPAYARYSSQRDGGLARIAERGRFKSILDLDGAGAYWSFTMRSNDYQKEAQIELQQGQFSSGFAGRDRGFVLRLAKVPLDAISDKGPIPGVDPAVQKRVDFLRDLVPVAMSESSNDLEVDAKDVLRADEMGLRQGAIANLGDSYLVRCVQTGQQDVLAAFQVVAKDDAALTLAWKILRQRPASR
jgi:RNA polymerase sigma factor (sigma-70 family)